MALGSTQPLTEMSTSYISWGKGGRFVRLTNLPPSCAVVKKSGNLNFLEPSGPLQACNRTALPFTLYDLGACIRTHGGVRTKLYLHIAMLRLAYIDVKFVHFEVIVLLFLL